MVGPKYHCLLEQNLDMQENMKTDNCGRTKEPRNNHWNGCAVLAEYAGRNVEV